VLQIVIALKIKSCIAYVRTCLERENLPWNRIIELFRLEKTFKIIKSN